MTHPLFYSPEVAGAVTGATVFLDSDGSAHAVRSQRLTTGDPVLVSDGAGTLAHGTITRADPQRAGIHLTSVTVHSSPLVEINLIQALAKGDRDLLAAEMATEVGVDAVTPWQAQRSIVRIRPERAAKTQAKWQAKLRAAAQQSRRAFIPGLHPVVQGSAIAQLHAPQEGQHLVVLHEDGQDDFDGVVDALPEATSCVHLAVGPEGGITDEELAAVEQAGGSVVKLGPHVMRASTAGPVGIALLNHLLKRW